ncbi:hypothetical protein CWI60_09270, partial [Neisseria meningitidis]
KTQTPKKKASKAIHFTKLGREIFLQTPHPVPPPISRTTRLPLYTPPQPMTAAPDILYRQAAALLEQSNTAQALPLLQQAAEQG